MTYRALRWLLGPVVRLLWRVEVDGLERFPTGACVLVANHESVLDPFFLGIAVPRELRFVTKRELFRNPVLARLLGALGGIPIARGGGDRGAVGLAARALEAGDVVAVFPEGTVLPDAERGWKRGAARLALVAGVPIVPVRLVDTARAFRPVTRRLGFPIVRVVVGEPIAVARARPTPERTIALTQALERAVRELAASS